MKFYSTRNHSHQASLEEALFSGLAPDGGLYMPEFFPETYSTLSPGANIQSIAKNLLQPYLQDTFSEKEIQDIINETSRIEIPLVKLVDGLIVCELFHGPTLAFKDFGARFMAAAMSRLLEKKNSQLTILVATSGDTGGAVASGFFQKKNIRVIILYPKGKVSALQEKQLTTWGGNISAICVRGTFDDCQGMVKSAFADTGLRSQVEMTSANSINIGRLLPQMIYYAYASSRIYSEQKAKPVIVVPSGNFGNLTAGLFAQRMGYPIHSFLAVTNSNSVVPEYLSTGQYNPRPSVATLSNAMDVGSPSNMERIEDLFGHSIDAIRKTIRAAFCDDTLTMQTMRDSESRFNYTCDPHTAVGIAGALKEMDSAYPSVIMSTAHPAKFKDDVERILDHDIPLPSALEALTNRASVKTEMGNDYAELKTFLLGR